MKKFTLYIVLVAGLLVSACGDFLEVEPETLASGDTYYRTPEQAYRALVGCYDGLQSVWASGVSLPVAAEVLSDNTFGGTGATDGWGYQALDEFDRLRSPSDQNLFDQNWIAYYKAVYRCNVLIGKMDQIEWGTDGDLRPQYESEARFLRAYLYFDMVRLWGNIPLLTEPSTENVSQSPADDVYRVIAEDLKYAVDNMPDVAYSAQPVAERGRITKWAAEALLGRVYLYYTGYYGKTDLVGLVTKAQALEYLEDCIAKSGHALVDDFTKLWPAASVTAYAGEDNIETVFAIKYTYTSNYSGDTDGNHWLVLLGIRDKFSYPYGNGWGGSTVTKALWDAYSETDTRRAASIISVVDEEISVPTEGQREYTGYYGKKYIPMVDEDGKSIAVVNGATDFMIGQFQDYVSIRYADVLLMAAELGSGNAQAYFDDVRERAYRENFASIPVTQAALMEERRLEFALEGIRYWDLLRQGIEVAANAINTTVTVQNGGVDTQKQIAADNVRQTMGLQQIPYTQITLSNNVLKQNNGW
ncbi:RagB/SusD family nutrient uptake outer membrane protein [Fulvivirgaceae bacterium PWU5]|uniref:RagB/SusD family nutrient uptake outer membrane protein n=1 Tax=Dawidia cretensis TaxID=2782350 RepID=A0AAP2DWQ5_9BACT|nr:RagB/SusD family nutrient uptake outer membrane protein [Dawidia cretensis]MBT1708796.1 RagB/SusD family nutrient uptake outer membrane protein [Dawidia cretensis]